MRRRRLAMLISAAVCVPLVAEQRAAEAELLPVRTDRGTQQFFIKAPHNPTSVAWLEATSFADRNGEIPAPIGGYELSNRVVVPSTDPLALRGLVRGLAAGAVLEALPSVPNYWVITVGDVRAAIALADAMAFAAPTVDAHVDLSAPVTLRSIPDDPEFDQQWHLYNEVDPQIDVNVVPVWCMGITGAGVVIGIVEGAWQHDHPDLIDRFNEEASQVSGLSPDPHATAVAGVAAASAFNDSFGSGAAYGAQLSNQIIGLDSEKAEALAFRSDLNDIKNNSWGPRDDGTITYLPTVVRAAIEDSITTGRGGLGTVFVWAAGNGGGSGDRVDYDPYASSRFTIAVGAIGDADTRAVYNELGSSMFVVAHSSGNNRGIYTTSINDGETRNFGGTSSAAPLASGVIALMLEADPTLTWRDVQDVLAQSARMNDPGNTSWRTNGAGHAIHYSYGFGAVDAQAALLQMQGRRNLAHEIVADTGVIYVNQTIPDNDTTGLTRTVQVDRNVRIETVELILNAQIRDVGDLRIVITSPDGTKSLFAEQRASDATDDYVNYVFTSVRHRDEQSAGQWTVKIADERAIVVGTWIDYQLKFYGTPTCFGDLSEDGRVDLADLVMMLTAFASCEDDPSGRFDPALDQDNSGCNDLADLSQFLTIFGTVCSP